MEKQTTLTNSIALSGRGPHTGQEVQVTLCPAPANHGIIFRRVDVTPQVDLPALATLVSETARGTTLSVSGTRVATVEHLLSALHGLGIDNVLAEVSGEEIPILDGSARPWVEAIQQAGVTVLNADRHYYTIHETITMEDAANGVEYIALPCDDFRVTAIIDFKSAVIGKQVAEMDAYSDYASQVAPCRTFVFLHEIEPLLAGNLIKGGDIDNALVFVDKPLAPDQAERLAMIYNQNVGTIKVNNGVLNTVEPYFCNEPARHKMLDFIGDIALTGIHLHGHFIIRCPGHKNNVAFAQMLQHLIAQENHTVEPPVYNACDTPVLDNNAVRRFLPHSYPCLFVDKVIEFGKDYLVAVKNVTTDEPYFKGHFPDNPIMPGVLQLEAMAQAGGLLVQRDFPDPQNYSTVLARIDGVKFRQLVVPGDTLVIHVAILTPLRRGCLKIKGTAFVGNNIVTEATIVAQIIKKENIINTK